MGHAKIKIIRIRDYLETETWDYILKYLIFVNVSKALIIIMCT